MVERLVVSLMSNAAYSSFKRKLQTSEYAMEQTTFKYFSKINSNPKES